MLTKSFLPNLILVFPLRNLFCASKEQNSKNAQLAPKMRDESKYAILRAFRKWLILVDNLEELLFRLISDNRENLITFGENIIGGRDDCLKTF